MWRAGRRLDHPAFLRPSPRGNRWGTKIRGLRLLDQTVELAGVFAGDLLDHVLGQVAELFLDVLGRLGPDAVGVGVVGGPHDGLVAEDLEALLPGADLVELERRLALALPVVA